MYDGLTERAIQLTFTTPLLHGPIQCRTIHTVASTTVVPRGLPGAMKMLSKDALAAASAASSACNNTGQQRNKRHRLTTAAVFLHACMYVVPWYIGCCPCPCQTIQ